MSSPKIEVFFSCSFLEEDREVNDFFLAIGAALGLVASNVSTGHPLTPPNVAKKKIGASHALIGICTRRDELKSGGYHMPAAVRDEISFAVGADKPVLIFVEDGVSLAGFAENYGTFLRFCRDRLTEPAFLRQAVEAIFNLRVESLSGHQADVWPDIDAFADNSYSKIELKHHSGQFIWEWSGSKRLIYSRPSKRAIPAGFWPTVPPRVPADAKPMQINVDLHDASPGLQLSSRIEYATPTSGRAIVTISPNPQPGDFVDYSVTAESRYLNPVWSDEVSDSPRIRLGDDDYRCADGVLFKHPTRLAVLELRLPKQYGLTARDVRPFVASHITSIVFEVESELKRCKKKVEQFGGCVLVRLEIENPLPGHMYGVAWNPPTRPESLERIDRET